MFSWKLFFSTEVKGGIKLLSVKIVKYLLGKYLKAMYIGFYKGYIKIYRLYTYKFTNHNKAFSMCIIK